MCSTFMHQKTTYNCAYSKSHYEAPKQLLQLRSEIKPLLASDSCYSSDTDVSSPSPRALNYPPKHVLQYIEKDRRSIASSSSASTRSTRMALQQYQAYDLPVHHSRKTTAPPLMRTPSSGFSSSSSSENMFSALSINNGDQKIQELLDPAIEVDLDMFMEADVRYKQPVPVTNMSASRRNVSTVCGPSHSAAPSASNRQVSAYQNKNVVQNPYDYSYSNVKRSTGYTDYLPTVSSQPPAASTVPLSPSSWIRCQYCWETYVKLCQRVASQDPLVPCDGPWQWHNLYDAQGRVTCPRLWFTQLDRAGSDMIQQMGHKGGVRHAPV